MPQYSQNVSEQIMKSDKLGSGLPWKLLAFSVFIFLLAVLSYFALSLGYSNYLNNQISQTEDNTRALTQKVSTDAQNKFIDIYSRLSNYKSILADHIYASGVFPLLESITYPTIYYTDVQLNTTDSTLVLSGIDDDIINCANGLDLINNIGNPLLIRKRRDQAGLNLAYIGLILSV
ncbi:MAG: hypothetical protein M1155_02585 [Patescibacteria group bacterium]|nr:hypothetical protein [Patescibacteria group bacterium]